MLRLVALACLVAGCAVPTFTTSSGVDVYDPTGTVTPAQAETIDGWLLDLWERLGYDRAAVAECLGQLEVVVEPEPIPCTYRLDDGTWVESTCGGTREGTVARVAAQPCGYATAYAHEACHWLGWCLGAPLGSDHDHADPAVWLAFRNYLFEC